MSMLFTVTLATAFSGSPLAAASGEDGRPSARVPGRLFASARSPAAGKVDAGTKAHVLLRLSALRFPSRTKATVLLGYSAVSPPPGWQGTANRPPTPNGSYAFWS